MHAGEQNNVRLRLKSQLQKNDAADSKVKGLMQLIFVDNETKYRPRDGGVCWPI